ncbi:hypothetical protein [Reinekea sp.]|jgi:hypothetical protein|uniref:hypothetical protein n=1 Tax=Reinekea sp. TaxID=1970455 RepID=UPI003989947C
MNNEQFERRLDEWACYVVGNYSIRGLGYSPVAPGFSEFVKNDRAPVVSDDREMEIERAVCALALRDPKAAEVIRAEYRAHPKYGDARFEDGGNAKQLTYRQLAISERTYRSKLEKAKDAIWVLVSMRKTG